MNTLNETLAAPRRRHLMKAGATLSGLAILGLIGNSAAGRRFPEPAMRRALTHVRRGQRAMVLAALVLAIPIASQAAESAAARDAGSDRVAMVTGATDGLGRAVATALAEQGFDLILHGRNQGKLDDVAQTLRSRHPGLQIETERADFLSLPEVECMAVRIVDRHPRLHLLINNAGIGRGHAGGARSESHDGNEALLAVNYLAGFHLTLRLLPVLQAAAPSRIVHVASAGQHPIDFSDPDLRAPGAYDGQRAYGQSKLAQIMFSAELAQRLAGTGVTSNALHPGSLMPTKLAIEGWGRTIDSLETGVHSVMHLATDPALAETSGRYFDRTREAQPLQQALDASERERLMAMSRQKVESALSTPAALEAIARCGGTPSAQQRAIP